jgi:methanogenic corrinoid protein MtbC1
MKAVLEEKDEIRRENRFKDLAKKLEENLDQVLSESLVTPIPQKAGEKGYAPFVGIAAKVTEVSAASDPNLYERFTENLATPVLQKAISELTNGKIKDFTDGNIQQTTAAIMGNVISNYERLTPENKKMALVQVVLGDVPEDKKAFAQAISTAAAIELSGLKINKEHIDKVMQFRNGLSEESSQKDINKAKGTLLNALGITRTNNKRFDSFSWQSAQEILNGNFSQPSIDPRAWAVVSQQQEAISARA